MSIDNGLVYVDFRPDQIIRSIGSSLFRDGRRGDERIICK